MVDKSKSIDIFLVGNQDFIIHITRINYINYFGQEVIGFFLIDDVNFFFY